MTKISKAFCKLRRLGYFAKQNYWCCSSCAVYAISQLTPIPDKYVFYNKQSGERIRKTGGDYLQWDGNGEEIAQALKDVGLEVEWNGTKEKAIRFKDPDFVSN